MCGNCFSPPVARFEPMTEIERPGGARVWPVFRRIRPPRQPRLRPYSACSAIWDRAMRRAFDIQCARRWICETPLQRRWDRVDEAITASRGTRA
jgi:hypothetical protein